MSKERIASFLYQKVVLPSTSPFCETAHEVTFKLLEQLQQSDFLLNVSRREFGFDDKRLVVEALGLEFPSPFLLAAGIDKDARAIPALATLGVGGLESGSYTWEKREGNPKIRKEKLDNGRVVRVKRLERFPDGTIINWMGFPGVGTRQATANFEKARPKTQIPVGVSVAVSPDQKINRDEEIDLKMSLGLIYPRKPDWLTFNVSCPNCSDHYREIMMVKTEKLMTFFAKEANLLADQSDFRIPILVKLSPDMTTDQIERLVLKAKEEEFDGIVATNTTTDRTDLPKEYAGIKKGGISGPLLFERALETVRQVRKADRKLGGKPLVIMGGGGVDSVEKWVKMQEAGADLCQILTGFVFGGPYFFKNMNRQALGR